MLGQLRERKVLRRNFDRGLKRSGIAYKPTLESNAIPIQLSEDVLVMAQAIASEWGLKTPRDAVEAVFRKYANEYMYGRQNSGKAGDFRVSARPIGQVFQDDVQCEAMNELDGLLGM